MAMLDPLADRRRTSPYDTIAVTLAGAVPAA